MAARLLNYQEIFRTLGQHISLVFIAISCAISVSVPLGIIITRPAFKKIVPIVDNTVNIAQTVPGLAVLALFYTILGLGFKTAIFALWLYSLLPILRNTSAGIQAIPDDIIEAAKGMGMTPLRILTRIELPLALPIIMAGIRVSAVVVTGSAALSTFIGAGGLGDLIVTGLALRRNSMLFTGGILTALLGIFMDTIFGNLENYLLKKT
jgi:osmoprotectant transport system permease protein